MPNKKTGDPKTITTKIKATKLSVTPSPFRFYVQNIGLSTWLNDDSSKFFTRPNKQGTILSGFKNPVIPGINPKKCHQEKFGFFHPFFLLKQGQILKRFQKKFKFSETLPKT